MSEDAITNLQRRVAALEALRDKRAFDEITLKSQAAQQQAENHLYAPLRNNTRAVIDMAAFVRKVATLPYGADAISLLIDEAQEILKRST